MDWAAQELHLIRQHQLRCEGRPYHTSAFQVNHGVAPVTFSPRVVALLSSVQPAAVQLVTVCNRSPTNTVRFSLTGNEFPAWASVAPVEGFIAPLSEVVLQFTCHCEEADKR